MACASLPFLGALLPSPLPRGGVRLRKALPSPAPSPDRTQSRLPGLVLKVLPTLTLAGPAPRCPSGAVSLLPSAAPRPARPPSAPQEPRPLPGTQGCLLAATGL